MRHLDVLFLENGLLTTLWTRLPLVLKRFMFFYLLIELGTLTLFRLKALPLKTHEQWFLLFSFPLVWFMRQSLVM